MRLRAAARAKIMRWVKPKIRSGHEPPQIVREQWASGNKNELAEMLVNANFNKDMLSLRTNMCIIFHQTMFDFILQNQELFINELRTVVSRKAKVKLIINEGWHTEAEMLSDLKWTQ